MKATSRSTTLSERLLGELGSGGARSEAEIPGDAEVSQALVRRYFEMWNTGNWTEADAVLGPTYLDHAYPSVMGPAAVRSLVRRFRAENPDASMTAEVVAFDSEYVVVRRAIHRSAREKTERRGVALFRVAGGQLAEQWSWSPTAERTASPGRRELREQEDRRAHSRDVEDLVELFAADRLLERTSLPPGGKRRGEARKGIRRLVTPPMRADRNAGHRVTGYDPIVVHATEDPEVFVVESDVHGEDAAGAAYQVPYIQIVRAHDGRVVVLRDYFDSLAMAERLVAAT